MKIAALAAVAALSFLTSAYAAESEQPAQDLDQFMVRIQSVHCAVELDNPKVAMVWIQALAGAIDVKQTISLFGKLYTADGSDGGQPLQNMTEAAKHCLPLPGRGA